MCTYILNNTKEIRDWKRKNRPIRKEEDKMGIQNLEELLNDQPDGDAEMAENERYFGVEHTICLPNGWPILTIERVYHTTDEQAALQKYLFGPHKHVSGHGEKYVGEFITKDREHFVVATKYTLFTKRDDPNFSGNHRKNMVQALDASLKRLKTDYVDLYWLHAWDFTTPEEEVLRVLDDMVRAGKIFT